MKFLSSIVRHSLQLSKKPTISGFPSNPAKTFTHPINQQNNSSSKDLADSPTPFKTTSTVNETTEIVKQKKQLVTDSPDNIETNNNEQIPIPATHLTNTSAVTKNNDANYESQTTAFETPTTPLRSQDEARLQGSSIKLNRAKAEASEPIVLKTTKQQKYGKLKTGTANTEKLPQPTSEHKQHSTTTKEAEQKQGNTLSSTKQKNKTLYSHSESVTLKNTQKDTTKTKTKALNNYYITRQKPAKSSLLKTTKQTKILQQTPQVRIGQINVLIEDQAKITSKPKPTTNTQANSPFGYRGL